MKFALALVTVLAISGLGQAHQLPDFGKGPLHEDLQDFLDLIPMEKISEVFTHYMLHDPEVKSIVDRLRRDPTVIRNLWIEFQSVPELFNLLNYMQKEGVEIYYVINLVNKALNIKEIVPPNPVPPSSLSFVAPDAYSTTTERTGGLVGLCQDIKALFNYDDFIITYVKKMRNSKAFVNFINELKSDNFQKFVTKFYYTESLQYVLNALKSLGVNTRVVADYMYLFLGIMVPDRPPKNLQEELLDFIKLVPAEQFLDIVLKYVNEDEKVRHAFQYLFTPQFHNLVRAVEALKEHQALVVFVQKAGLNVIEGIQQFHRSIGMEEYVPPELENLLAHKAGLQKVGDGMKGMLKDLWAILPLDEIDALYQEKMRISLVFSEFIEKMSSPEMQEIITNLYNHPIYKIALAKTRAQGLELEAMTELASRILGIQFPKIKFATY